MEQSLSELGRGATPAELRTYKVYAGWVITQIEMYESRIGSAKRKAWNALGVLPGIVLAAALSVSAEKQAEAIAIGTLLSGMGYVLSKSVRMSEFVSARNNIMELTVKLIQIASADTLREKARKLDNPSSY